jgi:hypothetical protein
MSSYSHSVNNKSLLHCLCLLDETQLEGLPRQQVLASDTGELSTPYVDDAPDLDQNRINYQ